MKTVSNLKFLKVLIVIIADSIKFQKNMFYQQLEMSHTMHKRILGEVFFA